MQSLKYGVEIEFLGITREAAAEIVADFFGTGYFYEGGDLKERDIADSDQRIWRVVRDASIEAYSDEEQCELVTPILTYPDLEILQQVVDYKYGHHIFCSNSDDTLTPANDGNFNES